MKTRIISTDIWDEDAVFTLNIDTKLLYLILLTNPFIGQTRFYKISDRQLSTYSGLNIEQVQKCKRDLENQNMVLFKDSYVCITGYGFVECFYKGAKNEQAKVSEVSRIPQDVLHYFIEKLDTLSIPYQYPTDTPLNHKSGIINHKSGIIKGSDENLLDLPDWLNKDVWREWVDDRRSRKISIKKRTLEKHIKFLSDHIEDHAQIIQESIRNEWQGLFPLKGKDKAGNKYQVTKIY